MFELKIYLEGYAEEQIRKAKQKEHDMIFNSTKFTFDTTPSESSDFQKN